MQPKHRRETNSVSSRPTTGLVLCVLIALQACLMVYLGFQKQEFHIDEIYSYVFSNSTNAETFSAADWLLDEWTTGAAFDELTTVQEGEQFRLDAPYYNTSLDCHPPLYYWALHIVCSMMPNTFTKWTGLGLNIGLFAITQVFVYLCACQLISSRRLRLAAVALYGFSALAINTVLYIRMYELLTLLTVIYVYLNLLILRDGVSLRRMILAAVVLYLGAMTQYYFLLFAFWSALIIGVRLLMDRKIKDALIFGACTILAVVLMLVSFPYAIEQATGSPTNNIGNEVARSALNMGLWVHQIYYLCKDTLEGFCFSNKLNLAFLGLLALTVVVTFVQAKKPRKELLGSLGFDVPWLMGSFVLTFLTVAKVGGEYVYPRYIFYVIPVAYLAGLTALERIAAPSKEADGEVGRVELRTSKTVELGVAALLAIAVVASIRVCQTGSPSFTYKPDAEETAAVKQYDDLPLVVMLALDSEGDVELTGNYTKVRLFDQVFVGARKEVVDDGVLADCIREHGSCLLYIPTDTYWIEGFERDEVIEELVEKADVRTAVDVTDSGFGRFCLITG